MNAAPIPTPMPGEMVDGMTELEERADFLNAACIALARYPEPAAILTGKALSGLAWWTMDIVARLRELNKLAGNE
ncbi:MAG: hypothetical protein J1E80_06565 [Desulfovibrionaceae bacterium]|nr:hypothetical protein [Desulfovibrionaceae bacterium]